MNLLKTRFGIDDLMLAMMQVPPERLSLEQLQEWIAHLDLRDELFKQHIAFCSQSYQRRLVCRTSRFDLLVLGWQPGQASSIHDHADSLNVTRVYQGCLTARLFDQTGPRCSNVNSSVQLQQETHLQADELATVDRYQIHQLANTSNENLVTLHLYARPLQTLQVYCPDSGQIERVPVQYDLVEIEE